MVFLIEYDRLSGTIVQMRKFGDAWRKVAEDTRLELELKLNSQGVEHEVVLFDAPNEEALRHTHGRYFQDLAELARGSAMRTKI